jgi:hypothetical protein
MTIPSKAPGKVDKAVPETAARAVEITEKPIATVTGRAIQRDEGVLRKVGRRIGGWFKKFNRYVRVY